MPKWSRFALMICLLAAGCSREEEPLPQVEPISSDDPELNAAMEKARASFQEFLTTSQDPDTMGAGFLAKVRVTEGDVSEDLWINGVRPEEEGYSGIVNESPMKLKDLEAFEEIRFTLNQVSDWQYFAEEKIVGAYTTQVMRSRMSEEERAEHDAMYPFPFE